MGGFLAAGAAGIGCHSGAHPSLLVLAAGWHGIGQMGPSGLLAALFLVGANTAAAVLIAWRVRRWPQPVNGRLQVVEGRDSVVKEES